MRNKWKQVECRLRYGQLDDDIAYAVDRASADRIASQVNAIIDQANWLELVAIVAMKNDDDFFIRFRGGKWFIKKWNEPDENWDVVCEWTGNLADGHSNAPALAAALGIELPKEEA